MGKVRCFFSKLMFALCLSAMPIGQASKAYAVGEYIDAAQVFINHTCSNILEFKELGSTSEGWYKFGDRLGVYMISGLVMSGIHGGKTPAETEYNEAKNSLHVALTNYVVSEEQRRELIRKITFNSNNYHYVSDGEYDRRELTPSAQRRVFRLKKAKLVSETEYKEILEPYYLRYEAAEGVLKTTKPPFMTRVRRGTSNLVMKVATWDLLISASVLMAGFDPSLSPTLHSTLLAIQNLPLGEASIYASNYLEYLRGLPFGEGSEAIHEQLKIYLEDLRNGVH